VSFRLTSCAPRPHAGSIATFWDATAAAVLGASNTSEPVQARDLFDVSAAMEAAFRATAHDGAAAQESAISFAAYRLLVWRASFGSNLGTSFALLAHALHARCLAPGFTTTAGRAPAAIGNRIAAAAIAAGDHDGSHEAIHYADTSYVPVNAPLAVGKPGTTVHDPTFWQPLALPQAAPLGVATVPAAVQAFVDPQWGAVSTFAAATARLRVPTQQLGYPSSVTYKRAAIATIRATADGAAAAVDTSPLGWNRSARTHAGGPLAADLRLYRTLNGALNDAAVAAWRSKRALQAPRPISIVRYLAFHGQSTDPKAAAYSSEGLPLVAGLTRLDRTAVEVRLRGRWVRGEDWVAPTPTPASPGGVAEASAFAYAADTVLSALTHGSFAAVAAQASNAALTGGIDTPGDLQAGRSIGRAVGRLALSVR
jgi:hypothetical protein